MSEAKIQINMTAPEVTLMTQGKYCPTDVVVTAALEEKTVTTNGTYAASDGYAGIGTIVVAVPTSADPNLEEKTVEITENGTTAITPTEGYDGISSVNITTNVPILDTSDATAVAANILKGKTAYVNGTKITGTIPNYDGTLLRAVSTLTFEGQEVNSITDEGEEVTSIRYKEVSQ